MSAAGPGARGRVDTGLILWLCRRLGTMTIKKDEWPARPDRGAVAMEPEAFRMAWLPGSTRWSYRERRELSKLIGDCVRCYFRDEQRSRLAMPMLLLDCVTVSPAAPR